MLRGSHKFIKETLERIVKKYNCELDVSVISDSNEIGSPEYYYDRYTMAKRGEFDYELKTLLENRLYLVLQDGILRFILIDDRLTYLDFDWSKIIEKELIEAKNYWESLGLGYQY